MQDVVCKLVKNTFTTNSIGVETSTRTETECPIIKVESIYEREYYEANQSGFKPTLRLRISTLNYNQEEELIYMNQLYTIIRIENQVDETILICERKIGDVNQAESTSNGTGEILKSV